jgi:hypothetical protein
MMWAYSLPELLTALEDMSCLSRIGRWCVIKQVIAILIEDKKQREMTAFAGWSIG